MRLRNGRVTTARNAKVRPRLLAGVLLGMIALLLSASGPVMAQIPPPEPTPDPTDVLPPEPSPSPTAQPPAPQPGPLTPSEADEASNGGEGATWVHIGGGAGKRGDADADPRGRGRRQTGDPCEKLKGVRPPRGSWSTAGLAAILAPIERLGVSAPEAFRRVAGPFPIAAEASWSNDWHTRRCVPDPHLHEGIDIFSVRGAPLVATAEARVTQKGNSPVAGLSVEITDQHGVQYFYAHLSRFADGLSVGQQVETGEILGYVGTTGNARGTSPHLHLEIQPGGVPVPPKPYVDRWLETAERRASHLVRSVRGGRQSASSPSPFSRWEEAAMAGPVLFAPTRSAALGPTARKETLSPSAADLGIARGFAGASTGGAMGLALLAWRRRQDHGEGTERLAARLLGSI